METDDVGSAIASAVATAAATLLPGNASTAAARANAIAAAAIESADEHSDWSRVELFVIAALQLVLVLVAYRLDKAPHPSLISESAWAMFFGVIVRHAPWLVCSCRLSLACTHAAICSCVCCSLA